LNVAQKSSIKNGINDNKTILATIRKNLIPFFHSCRLINRITIRGKINNGIILSIRENEKKIAEYNSLSVKKK
jgi:hypothetical protein